MSDANCLCNVALSNGPLVKVSMVPIQYVTNNIGFTMIDFFDKARSDYV